MKHSLIRRLSLAVALMFSTGIAPATAQVAERPLDVLFSFPVQGLTVSMDPDAARSALLSAGFAEKGGGDLWGVHPTGSFSKDRIEVSITHYEGRILALAEVRLAEQGQVLDYGPDVERIRTHFSLTGADAEACREDPALGTRCVIRDGRPPTGTLVATLTGQMISIQVGRRER